MVRREHTKGDAAIRGPAHDLLMVLWRRDPLDTVDVIGDQAVAEHLVPAPTWSDPDRQSLCRRTSETRWSASLRRISEARSRVGRMFSRRLRPLIVVQMRLRRSPAPRRR